MNFIASLLTKQLKRKIVLSILNCIIKSKEDSIDKSFTESILTCVAKSNGNSFTTFIMDK